MELRVLRSFLAVAEEGNVTRASNLLNISQPALSRQISALEEELGVQLLIRGSHSVILTDEGIILKRRAEELLSLAERTVSDVTNSEAELSGTISIGAGELGSMNHFATLITEFRNRHPLVSFDIYSGVADDIKDRLLSGVLDFGLLAEPADTANLDFIRLADNEEWGFLMPASSPLAVRNSITPSDLKGESLLTSSRTAVKAMFRTWLGHDYTPASSFNLLYNAAMLVRSGMGIALTLKLSCSYDDLVFVPLEPRIKAGSIAVWKAGVSYSPAVRAFIEYIRNAVSA